MLPCQHANPGLQLLTSNKKSCLIYAMPNPVLLSEICINQELKLYTGYIASFIHLYPSALQFFRVHGRTVIIVDLLKSLL